MIPTTPRIEAIKGLDEAKGRESFAHLIAYGTRFSPTTCQRILAAAPRASDMAEQAKAAPPPPVSSVEVPAAATAEA